jgi:hypothetical protein
MVAGSVRVGEGLAGSSSYARALGNLMDQPSLTVTTAGTRDTRPSIGRGRVNSLGSSVGRGRAGVRDRVNVPGRDFFSVSD